MNRPLFAGAAILGMFTVALGAFGAHGLKHYASEPLIAMFNLAVQYQFYHVFALIFVALAFAWSGSRLLWGAAVFFAAGILMFCGSLYIYALTGVKWLGMITPMGGFAFMLGWLCLAVAILRRPQAD